jgi:tetratricopeptide (TPR) repeat protein
MSSRINYAPVTKLAARYLAAITVCFLLSLTVVGNDKARSRADKAMRSGDYQLAEKLFREMLGRDAHDNDARLGLSLALLKQRNLQGAYDHAARVILVDPLSARAHALLGATILVAGDFRTSIEEFKTAVAINDEEPIAVAGLAMINFYENRLEEAIRGLRRAVNLDPDEADNLFNLGQAAARNEQYKEAADAYERFLLVAPKTDADRRDRIRGLIDFLRYLGSQGKLYVPGGANKTVIPFETIDDRPILKVRINGQKTPLRFVLDTGSGMSVVSDETARRLGLKPVARGGLARAVGGGGRFEIVYGYLSSLELGEAKVENVPVYIRHFFDEKTPVDGYLGLSMISKFIASIDYQKETFTLVRQRSGETMAPTTAANEFRVTGQTLLTATPPAEIPLRTTSSGFLSGEVMLEGLEKPFNFIIDTGATVTVVSEKLAELEQMTAYVQPTKMRVYGAAGITDDVKTVRLPKIMLGSLVREQVNAAVLDLEPVNETAGFTQNGILGANFLRHFRVQFDFSRGVIRLEPLADTVKSTDGAKPDEM